MIMIRHSQSLPWRVIMFLTTTIILNRCSQAISDGNVTTGPPVPDEGLYLKKLRSDLLTVKQYDKWSRPVKNHATQTKVDMKITINEFVELDTVKSVLVTDAWFHISWKDEYLSWDPNDYGQLKQIHFGSHELWKPDIVLINTADQGNMLDIFSDSDIVVNSTGDVTWITMGLLKSKCPVWANDYPFANRPIYCRLTFCSLIYQASEVNLTTPADEFFLEGPWYVNQKLQFINITGDRYERAFEGYGSYSFESLMVQLKRKDSSFNTIVRIPTLVAVVLVLCMFFIPVTWYIRIQLALFAILIQLLLILFIGHQLGVNAIGLARPVSVLRSDLVLSSIALILTLVFRRLLMKADSMPQLPYVASSLLSGPVARLLCFGINQNDYFFSGNAGSGRIFNHSSVLPTVHPSRTTSANLADVSIVSRYTGSSSTAAADMEQLTGVTSDDDDCSLNLGTRTTSSGHQPFGVAGDSSTKLSSSQQEWMLVIIFCDRVLFAFYAFIMIPRLI